ncbi:hypothetical protein [Paenibacillus sp. CMAA1364]
MRMLFSHMDEIILEPGQVHSIMLQSTSNLYRVRKLIFDWVQGQCMNSPYLFVREQDRDVLAKQKYVIHMKQSVFELAEDKEFSKWIVQHLKYQLEHDEVFISQYNEFMHALEKMIFSTTLYIGDVQIEFDLTEKLMESILKQLSFQLSISEQTSLQSLQLRKLYIDLLLKLNVQQKDIVIIYEYPENDAAIKDYEALMLYLKSLNVTVLCISSSKDFVKYTDIENLILMYDNGSRYNLLKLKEELELFEYDHPTLSIDQLTTTLSIIDFYGVYDLLDPKYVEFLESNQKPM